MTKPASWSPSPAEVLTRLKGRLFATTTEAAAVLEYDPRTVRKAVSTGEIPSVQVGATRRISVAWLTAQAGLSAEGGGEAAAG